MPTIALRVVRLDHRRKHVAARMVRKETIKMTAVILCVLTILVPTGTAAQTTYKCVQGGKTIYQAEPCPATATQDTLKSPGGAPAPAATAGAEVNRMIDFMSTYRACADGITIWGQEMAGPYEELRSRNSAMVSRIENDRQLQALYQQRVDAKRNGKAGMCREVALELRGM
jgi:Domain of unknown function (DUF4124)